MGRQWLHAKRLVSSLKKGRTTSKLVREISVAAKMGGADLTSDRASSRRLKRPKKRDERRHPTRHQQGRGIGDEKLIMEYVVFEGYAPHKVPLIVEVYTDNVNRTAPEIRVLFKKPARHRRR